MILFRRLLHSIDNHGLRGTILRALRRTVAAENVLAEPAADTQTRHPFDQAHGTDTGGYIPGELLASGSKSDLYNTAYYGISPSTLSAALALLPVAPDAFSFVDLGCGKGRALLVAATFPFRHLVGVELSPELVAVARANTSGDPRIAICGQDALTFLYPATPLVVYFYHPFLGSLLARILAELERQLRLAPRETFLLIANPAYPRVLARFGFLETVWDQRFPLSAEDAAADRHGISEERYALFRCRPPETPTRPGPAT